MSAANGESTAEASSASPTVATQVSQAIQINTSLDKYWFQGDRRNKNLQCDIDKFNVPRFDGNKIRYRDFTDQVNVIKFGLSHEKEDGAKIKFFQIYGLDKRVFGSL